MLSLQIMCHQLDWIFDKMIILYCACEIYLDKPFSLKIVITVELPVSDLA